MFYTDFVIERLGVGQNRSLSGFDLHPLDGHSNIDDVSLPPLGHRHGDDVMLPSEVVSYHCSDAVGRDGNIWIQVLRGLEVNWEVHQGCLKFRSANLLDPMFPGWGLVVMPPSSGNSTMAHHE